MWIDSHCHLTHERFGSETSATDMIERAKEVGVSGMLTISCQVTGDFPEVLKTAQDFENVWCSYRHTPA